MAARASMVYLIEHVRLMIHDPLDVDAHYTDEQIQGALDDNRLDVEDEPLAARLGATQFVASDGWWERTAVLSDAGGIIAPDTSDWRRGVWTFLSAQAEPVTLTGSTYDVYGASADLLEMWASALALGIEQFTADGLTVKRGGRSSLATLASQYRSRSKGYKSTGGVSVASWSRPDVNTLG